MTMKPGSHSRSLPPLSTIWIDCLDKIFRRFRHGLRKPDLPRSPSRLVPPSNQDSLLGLQSRSSQEMRPDRETMTAEKAEILGFLAAEGNEYHYAKPLWRFFPARGSAGKWYHIRYRQDAVEFTNLEPMLQRRFLDLLVRVYGLQKSRFGSKWRLRIRQKRIVSDLLSYSRLGSLKWKVPSAVMCGKGNIKAGWCGGYADGDGTARNQCLL